MHWSWLLYAALFVAFVVETAAQVQVVRTSGTTQKDWARSGLAFYVVLVILGIATMAVMYGKSRPQVPLFSPSAVFARTST